jgi:hypothetical protein
MIAIGKVPATADQSARLPILPIIGVSRFGGFSGKSAK